MKSEEFATALHSNENARQLLVMQKKRDSGRRTYEEN